MFSLDKPAPESCTAIVTTSVPASFVLRVTRHVTFPPFELNLIAFESKLRNTTFILIGSMFAATLKSASATASVKSICFACAGMLCTRMALRRNGSRTIGVGSIVDMPAAIFSNISSSLMTFQKKRGRACGRDQRQFRRRDYE